MQNENAVMREREISLVDLCVEVLLRWRVIVVVMLIGGILLGAFSYIQSSRTAASRRAQLESQELLKEQEAQMSGEELEEWQNANKQQLEEALTESQIANVNSAIMYEQLLEDKAIYQEQSVFMQMDPFRVPRAELTFLIVSDDLERTYNIEKVYEDLVTSVDLFAYVQETCGIESPVNELISLERTSYDQLQGSDTVRVSVLYSDEDTCRTMADAIVKYVQEQGKKLQSVLGEHEVELISQAYGMVMNEDVLTKQRNCESDIMTLVNNAVKLKSAFTDEEWYYYNYLVEGKAAANPDADVLEDGEDVTDAETAAEESVSGLTSVTPGVSIKFVILGMVLFAFIYVFAFFLLYILNNKLRAGDSLQELYNISQLGTVTGGEKKKKFLGVIDEWILKLRYRGQHRFDTEEAINLAAVATKMAVKKQGLDRVCLMGCDVTGATMKTCEQIRESLSADGVSVQILSNVLYDAEVMEALGEAQGAVLVETAGSTLYEEVVRELQLLNRQNITVLGGIVVER